MIITNNQSESLRMYYPSSKGEAFADFIYGKLETEDAEIIAYCTAHPEYFTLTEIKKGK